MWLAAEKSLTSMHANLTREKSEAKKGDRFWLYFSFLWSSLYDDIQSDLYYPRYLGVLNFGHKNRR